jgi:putative Ca2+/H+ antiporter (TMEM165/GDT1 family)
MTNELNDFRAMATRYDKRAHVFHGTVTATVTVTAAAIWF